MDGEKARRSVTARLLGAGLGAVSAVAALTLCAPSALADPPNPAPPPPILPTEQVVPPPTEGAVAAPPTEGAVAAPPTGVPHLASPDNLPPGTSSTPVGGPQGRTMGYLRELWHAIKTQDVSMSDALLLLAQRPLDPDATPPPGLPAGPQPPPTPAPVPPTANEPTPPPAPLP